MQFHQNLQHSPIMLIGDINLDAIMNIPHLPQSGHESTATSMQHCMGGSMLNTTMVLSYMHRHCYPIGCLGNDVWSQWITRNLSDIPFLHLDFIQIIDNMSTGMNFIAVTPGGERTMFGFRGANVLLSPRLIEKKVFHFPDTFQCLYLSGYSFLQNPQKDAVLKAIQIARQKKIPVVMDTALDPVLQMPILFREIVNQTDVCVLGIEEGMALFNTRKVEEIAKHLLRSGNSLAAIKLGKDGCCLADHDQIEYIPAFDIESLDTTAAGDAFTAGIIFSMGEQISLQQTGIICNALGALASLTIGGGLDLPGYERLVDFLIQNLESKQYPLHEKLPAVIQFLRQSALT